MKTDATVLDRFVEAKWGATAWGARRDAVYETKEATAGQSVQATGRYLTVPKQGHPDGAETDSTATPRSATPSTATSTRSAWGTVLPPKREAVVEIATAAVGALIGARGSTLQEIEQSTGCRIKVERTDATTSKVTIKGPSPAAVDQAQLEVLAVEISREQQRRPAAKAERAFEMAAADVPAVLGWRGSRLQQIEADTRTRVKLVRPADEAPVCVTIRGDATDVDAAWSAIQSAIEECWQSRVGPADAVAKTVEAKKPVLKWAQETIEVPEELVGALIGSGGSHLREIEKKTGAKIKIPPTGARLRAVQVRGEHATEKGAKANVEKALQLIRDWMGAWAEVTLKPWQVGAVIGWRQQTLRWIEEQSSTDGVVVKVTVTGNHAFIRGGSLFHVSAAKRLVEEQGARAPKPGRKVREEERVERSCGGQGDIQRKRAQCK